MQTVFVVELSLPHEWGEVIEGHGPYTSKEVADAKARTLKREMLAHPNNRHPVFIEGEEEPEGECTCIQVRRVPLRDAITNNDQLWGGL